MEKVKFSIVHSKFQWLSKGTKMTKTRVTLLIGVACLLMSQPFAPAASRSLSKPAGASEQILDQIGVRRGICVVLGDTKCELALELAKQTQLLIYIQLPRGQDVERARQMVDQAGLYGTRIFIEKGDLTKLHLADNLADALVAVGSARTEIPQAEALRVLRPQGKALLGRAILTKPFPKGIDDWSHPYHGPDNNPQSQDRVIIAPYLTQFLAEPRYAPVPQVAVASAGRVFKAFGHVAFKVREEPYLNKLVAFNGYNGTILWQRDLAEGVMIHRNTMIATPTTLYVGDDKSCKLIDAATGQLKDEIVPPVEIAGGTFWKWMALEDGILYALIGDQEQRDPTKKWGRDKHGWPWDPISEGFNQPEHPWGFGRNVLAIDPKTKKVLWHHQEDEPVDGRAICMSIPPKGGPKNGRVYIFRFGGYLACLDAKTGNIIWRKTPDNAPELFASLGTYLNRQDWRTNWRTTCYLKCSDKALYFAGPPIGKLLAVSAEDGSILWENSYSNFQLVLREDELYGISGQINKHPSVKFAALTGQVLAEIDKARRACTRPTGSADAIFFRAQDGSVRLDLATRRPQWISAMRPPCHDGVTIANGLLYWWPSVCDCQLTLYGVTCLGPAGDFDFSPQATEEKRLEKFADDLTKIADLPQSPADWPTFRADNIGSTTTTARVPDKSSLLWQFTPEANVPTGASLPTAPVAVGGLVFVSGLDGIVRALDVAMGQEKWKAYTGGAVRFPPTIWKGRALVGSGDGWVYCFEAKTGRLLWRFRAAPAERLIPVYGQLLSTWPAASGVLVDDGIAYVAAGIVNYDGTYVYALDAITGKIKWQNNTSGHLDRQARTGVSVQGHQLLYDGKLYLASGTSISPAVYDASDGKCLNDPAPLARCESTSPRGWELSLLADKVVAEGRPFYAHPKYEVYDDTVFNKVFLASMGERDIVWTSSQYSSKVMCFAHIDRASLPALLALAIGRGTPAEKRGLKDQPLWSYDCKDSVAWAVCSNAVLVATKSQIVALNLEDGKILWSHPAPIEVTPEVSCRASDQPALVDNWCGAPVPWGVAVDHDGRVIVSLEDGKVLCFGR